MEQNLSQNQCLNNDNCWCECKKIHVSEKDYVWNPAICNGENGKDLASIMDDSAIIWDEVIKSCDEEIKIISTNFNDKKVTCKTKFLYLLAVLLITIALLIAVSIYCSLIKYQAKNLLPFHDTKLKQFCIDSINGNEC